MLSIVLCLSFYAQSVLAQTEEAQGKRKIASKVVPVYPQLARSMALQGTVRLEALVLASGKIKTVQVKGGNAVLVQSAETAIRGWQWEKSDHETTELVEFKFSPN